MPISYVPNRGIPDNYFDIGYWGSVLAGRTTPPAIEDKMLVLTLTATARQSALTATSRGIIVGAVE